MATSQIASMLDELMGRNRNFAPDDAKARELKWTDSDVCKYYIVQFCPHDLFTNTKADLGTCGKIHDDALKTKFQEEDEKDSYKKGQYIDDFLRFCQRMLSDLSSRIKRAKERLALTQEKEERFREQMAQEAAEAGSGLNKEADEKILLLSEKITALVAEAETAGCSGNVEQAQGLLKLSDQLREEREQIRKSLTMNAQNLQGSHALREEYAAQQKAMEVCDTCGAFLIVGDAQQRIDDHLLGKQHVGYARLRAAVDRILDERKKVREEREKEMEDRRKKREDEVKKETDDRRKHRDKERESSHRDSRDNDKESSSRREREGRRERERDRDGERDRARYTSERSRDRDAAKRNSRDERAKERPRSRDRERRERRRSRDKEWERDKGTNRKRSRSRERKRSRSREQKGTKSRERRSRSRNRSKERPRKEQSKERSSKDGPGDRERNRSSRSASRGRDKKRLSEEMDVNVSKNSSGSQHRSRSRSRSRGNSDLKYTANDTEIKKEFEKDVSSERDVNSKIKSPSAREPMCDEIKSKNGLSP